MRGLHTCWGSQRVGADEAEAHETLVRRDSARLDCLLPHSHLETFLQATVLALVPTTNTVW